MLNGITEKRIIRIKNLIETKARLPGEFILSSGMKVNHYFDIKTLLLDRDAILLISEELYEIVIKENIGYIGGYGLGGRLMTGLVLPLAGKKGKPLFGFEIVDRKDLKEGDLRKYQDNPNPVIVGYLPEVDGEVIIFEDVVSTGKSVFKTVKTVENSGRRVAKIVVILERPLGGAENIRARGYNLTSLFMADSQGNVSINVN